MNKNERIEILCERILSKLKTDLNSHPTSLIDLDDLKERISQSIETEDNEEHVFNNLYPQFYVSAVHSLSGDILSDNDSFMAESATADCKVNIKEDKMAADFLANQLLDEELLSIHPSVFDNEYKHQSDHSETLNSVTAVSTNGENNLRVIEISDIICKLLPNTNRISIEKKLRKHSYEGYEAVLLQECITNSLEKGYEISEDVFQKLDDWLSCPHTHKSTNKHKSKAKTKRTVNHTCDATLLIKDEKVDLNVNEIGENSGGATQPLASNVPNTFISNVKERINFYSEIIPNLNKEKLGEELSSCSSLQEEDRVISKYLDQSTSIPPAVGENFSSNSTTSEMKNIEHVEVSSSPPQCESEDNDKGCVIVDVVKKNCNPLLIELDGVESSPGSVGSDVMLVEEVPSKSDSEPNNQVEEMGQSEPSPVQVNEISTLFKNEATQNDITEPNEAAYVEDIDADAEPWNEAHSICKLLPFFELNNIHQSIMDNYYHPQRKVKVLTEYIEMAIEEGHEIQTHVFEMLNVWQMNRKRPSSSNARLNKRQKHTNDQIVVNEYHPMAQPSTSTMQVVPNIPVEQPLPSTELFAENIPFEAQTLFETLPEETKSWYLKKVEFLNEITNLNKKYILSQILHCQTESDVMHVTTRLLEEQTMNILQQNPTELNTDMPQSAPNAPEDTVVVEERIPGEGEGNEEINRNNEENESTASTSAEEANGNQNSAADTEDRIQAHIQQLTEMFSDADPDFLTERANEVAGEHEKFVELVVELTENRTYPKLEEYLKRQQKMNMKKKFIEGMSVEEFMEYFEDPEKVFCETTKEMSKMYVTSARTQLMNDLPFHLSRRIDSVFRLNNFHYLPTLRTLRDEKGARKTKRKVGKQPGDLDDIFLKELCYAKMEDKIKEHYRNKEKDKQLAFERAKEAGELVECQCCFDDEILQMDMSSCENLDDLHFFCNNCVKRYAEEQIGQGKQEFICLQGECKHSFSLNTLKRLLKPSIFSNLLKRKQAEEIAAAGIEDLESCPFCNFATIMPNKEDKVFKCLNPECLKDSCRLCKESNHIPLRCQEVEKKKQTDARTFLENEMTEAMVRECYKCKKRFIKEEGCNKMICSCGAMMCYLCKQPIKGYDHFASDSRTTVKTNEDKCPLWSNSLQLHAEEVQQRAAEAKKKLDPDVDLLHDPTKDMPQVPDYLRKPRPNLNPQPIRGEPPRLNAIQIQLHRLQQHWQDENVRNFNFPRLGMMADLFVVGNERVQRHTHQHRHQHFYVPLPNPPPHAHLHPPPPAHHPPPPPAHQHQPQRPPFPPFVDDLAHAPHPLRDAFVHRPPPPLPPPQVGGRLLYQNPQNPPRPFLSIQQVLAPPPPPRNLLPHPPQFPLHQPQLPPQQPHPLQQPPPQPQPQVNQAQAFNNHRHRNHNQRHHHHHHHHHNHRNPNNNNNNNNIPPNNNLPQGNHRYNF